MFQPEAIISKDNLIHNVNYIRKIIGKNVKIMPVVKADAYGHGMIEICNLLSDNGIDGFCVALLEEAIEIRKNNINEDILHLGVFEHDFNNFLLDSKLILTINTLFDIKFLEKIGKQTNHKFRVHIKVDTGMTRLGVLPEDLNDIKDLLMKTNFICVEGVYTQLSSADEENQNNTDNQRKVFIDASNFLSSFIKSIDIKHFTPSAGVLKDSINHFNMIRPGISVYGINNVHEKHNLKPVLTLKAPVCLIKDVKKGFTIGYNRTYKASNDKKVAIVQIGYADAVPLEFSNNGFVEYNEQKIPILGKVSMDLICIDITNIKIDVGDKVIIYGGKLTKIEYVVKNKISSVYSILTSISKRVKRIYN